MNNKTFNTLIAAYITGLILTFGHAYNYDYTPNTSAFDGGHNEVRAMLNAITWPLYVSRVAFEGVRK